MHSSNLSQPAHYVGTVRISFWASFQALAILLNLAEDGSKQNGAPRHAAWSDAFPSSREGGDSVQLTSISTFNSFAPPEDHIESFVRFDAAEVDTPFALLFPSCTRSHRNLFETQVTPRLQTRSVLEPGDDVVSCINISFP